MKNHFPSSRKANQAKIIAAETGIGNSDGASLDATFAISERLESVNESEWKMKRTPTMQSSSLVFERYGTTIEVEDDQSFQVKMQNGLNNAYERPGTMHGTRMASSHLPPAGEPDTESKHNQLYLPSKYQFPNDDVSPDWEGATITAQTVGDVSTLTPQQEYYYANTFNQDLAMATVTQQGVVNPWDELKVNSSEWNQWKNPNERRQQNDETTKKNATIPQTIKRKKILIGVVALMAVIIGTVAAVVPLLLKQQGESSTGETLTSSGVELSVSNGNNSSTISPFEPSTKPSTISTSSPPYLIGDASINISSNMTTSDIVETLTTSPTSASIDTTISSPTPANTDLSTNPPTSSLSTLMPIQTINPTADPSLSPTLKPTTKPTPKPTQQLIRQTQPPTMIDVFGSEITMEPTLDISRTTPTFQPFTVVQEPISKLPPVAAQNVPTPAPVVSPMKLQSPPTNFPLIGKDPSSKSPTDSPMFIHPPAQPVDSQDISDEHCQTLSIEIQADQYGYETSWTLKLIDDDDSSESSTDNILAAADENTYVSFEIETTNICIQEGTYRWEIKDLMGDGIQPPGSYAVYLNGNEVIRGGEFNEGVIYDITIGKNGFSFNNRFY